MRLSPSGAASAAGSFLILCTAIGCSSDNETPDAEATVAPTAVLSPSVNGNDQGAAEPTTSPSPGPATENTPTTEPSTSGTPEQANPSPAAPTQSTPGTEPSTPATEPSARSAPEQANPSPAPTAGSPPTPSPPAEPSEISPAPNLPRVEGSTYLLTTSDQILSLAINGDTGRVTKLTFGTTELLTDQTVNSLNYGSSFWTSPQSTWGWPPPLDAAVYSHQLDGDSVLLTSPTTQQRSETVSVTKRFRAATDYLLLEYTITNEGTQAIQVAPWEVTRVRSSGFSFYPTGMSVTQEQLITTQAHSVTWLDYDNAGIGGAGLKNATDGTEGWLAHVDAGLLFLKRFEDVAVDQQAPGEGEVEIYADGGRAYIELEQQGPYVTLEPQQTSNPWSVRWKVVQLPPDLDATLGSSDLVEFTRNL